MAPNGTEFQWTQKSERAAALVAADQLTDVEIAKDAGIGKRTLERWKLDPLFRERVTEHVTAAREALKNEGIANRKNRVDALNERWEAMHRLRAARAIAHAHVPGGETGLLVRQVRLVKLYEPIVPSGGDDDEDDDSSRAAAAELLGERAISAVKGVAVEVEEYALDTGLLKELREHEKQAAQELGQWTEKREIHGDMLTREYVGIQIELV